MRISIARREIRVTIFYARNFAGMTSCKRDSMGFRATTHVPAARCSGNRWSSSSTSTVLATTSTVYTSKPLFSCAIFGRRLALKTPRPSPRCCDIGWARRVRLRSSGRRSLHESWRVHVSPLQRHTLQLRCKTHRETPLLFNVRLFRAWRHFVSGKFQRFDGSGGCSSARDLRPFLSVLECSRYGLRLDPFRGSGSRAFPGKCFFMKRNEKIRSRLSGRFTHAVRVYRSETPWSSFISRDDGLNGRFSLTWEGRFEPSNPEELHACLDTFHAHIFRGFPRESFRKNQRYESRHFHEERQRDDLLRHVADGIFLRVERKGAEEGQEGAAAWKVEYGRETFPDPIERHRETAIVHLRAPRAPRLYFFSNFPSHTSIYIHSKWPTWGIVNNVDLPLALDDNFSRNFAALTWHVLINSRVIRRNYAVSYNYTRKKKVCLGTTPSVWWNIRPETGRLNLLCLS